MSFQCDKCGADILTGEDGNYTGCEHYPVITTMLNDNRGNFLEDNVRVYEKKLQRKANERQYVTRSTKGYTKPKLKQVFVEAGYEPLW